MTDLRPYWHNSIDGDWCNGGAGLLAVVDLGIGERIAKQAPADSADVAELIANPLQAASAPLLIPVA
ncbi:hypothetical protein [Ostreiculturibacter nitratireducens]|uniref:hypothetical protein n=1 Tax=Ostreiculturibacter nitratireducens TaxID=3075226 RepID=UPI0031B57495